MAKPADDYDRHDKGALIDALRQRDREIAELRQERDEQDDLIRRFSEYEDDYRATLERWQQAFGMELTDDGKWTWQPFWEEYAKLTETYYDLVKRWNKAVPILNAGLQEVGRPLAASAAQEAVVRKLHRQGKSLRWIAEETSLGLRTVRTITGRAHGTDRTSKARRDRIEIGKFERAHWKAQKRTGGALPQAVAAVIETGAALVTEAKGLGRKGRR